MIKAAIFDMDGLLIDSEPLWHEAEVKVFHEVGMPITVDMCTRTQGMRIDQVVQYWKEEFPECTAGTDEIVKDIMHSVISLVQEKGTAKDGMYDILNFMRAKRVKMAIASSSYSTLINAVVTKLDIARFFDVLHSAESEEYGKPHPGVYIGAARKLGIDPEHCMAFEDSLNGVLAAKSARMTCVCVPDIAIKGSIKLAIADIVLESLEDFEESVWERVR